jgi:hypothetical protein
MRQISERPVQLQNQQSAMLSAQTQRSRAAAAIRGRVADGNRSPKSSP